MTVGRFMITSVSAPAIRDVFMPINWQKKSMPTRPYIMDGIPESVSAAYSIAATSFLFDAYSLRYIAAPTPRGSMITSEAIIMYSVLSMSGSMPILSER